MDAQVRFFRFLPEIPFLGKFGQKNQNCQIKVKIWYLQLVTKIVRLAPPAPLFNVGCKFARSFLATTAWHSFSRLGTQLNQGGGGGGILGIFDQV